MGLNAVKILGISITTNSKKEILEYIRKYLLKNSKPCLAGRQVRTQNQRTERKPLVIVTPNPEQVVYAQKDKHFADILNRADVKLPDGVGIVAAVQLLKRKAIRDKRKEKIQRIPGVELMEDLVKMAAERGVRVGLIGGRGGVAVEAFECLRRKYSGLVGWAEDGPGEFKLGHLGNLGHLGDLKRITEKIRSTHTRIVFVGLGAPKQEYFIEALQKALGDTRYVISDMQEGKTGIKKSSHVSRLTSHPLVFMSVGGSFNIIAGRLKRAPVLIRLIGFEWAWRLFKEPWRFRRQLALLQFLWLVLRKKFFVAAFFFLV